MMRKEDQKDLGRNTSRMFLRSFHSLSHYRPEENRELVNQECQCVSSIRNTDNENTKQKYKVHTPTNALFIKLDKILKFAFKITLTCSYTFRSMTIIREPSLDPS